MCINPGVMFTKRGFQIATRCRKCWQCVANQRADWVGRIIAEHRTSRLAPSFVTLTYGDDLSVGAKTGDHAKTLMYSDVQKFLKRLRKHGFPCRYFAAGEYGPAKGRSHWHLILFWTSEIPTAGEIDGVEWTIKHDGTWNFPHDPFWTHGVSTWDSFSVQRACYVAGYTTKKTDSDNEGLYRMSTVPILGAEYFKRWAEDLVRRGDPLPQEARYYFPEFEAPDGGRRWIYMSESVQNIVCSYYTAAWHSRYGDHPPKTHQVPMLAAWEDRMAPRMATVRVKPYRRLPNPPNNGVVYTHCRFDRSANAYYFTWEGRRYWWSYDEKGNPAWCSSLRVGSWAEGTRAAYAGHGEKATRRIVDDPHEARRARIAEAASKTAVVLPLTRPKGPGTTSWPKS